VQRDSLVAIYNANVTNKNDKILSHREYDHYFTASSSDYMIVEEYKDMAGMEEAFKMNDELEKKAWPDERKRKAFMDTMGAYFETWHGDDLISHKCEAIKKLIHANEKQLGRFNSSVVFF
jgi:hypothetical protein